MYHNSLANDPDIMIQLALVDVLIMENQTMTPWTSSNTQSKKGMDPECVTLCKQVNASDTVNTFAQTMEKMKLNYSFDYAVAVMR